MSLPFREESPNGRLFRLHWFYSLRFLWIEHGFLPFRIGNCLFDRLLRFRISFDAKRLSLFNRQSDFGLQFPSH